MTNSIFPVLIIHSSGMLVIENEFHARVNYHKVHKNMNSNIHSRNILPQFSSKVHLEF